MIGKLGSDQQQLADLGGGVISEDGATLLSGESTGEASLLFGPAALREIQSGVANGDFSIPPADAEATITADNALPYWTFTDVSSAGAITCALVADATAGSGNVLRWSVAASTTTGKSATLTRFVPVASSRNRAFAHIPELNTASATNTANASLTITYQYYKLDYTTTGSSGTSTATFATLGTGTNWMNPAVSTTTATPSDAAFIYVEIKVSTTGTTPASISTVDITEARVIRGDQTNLFAEYTTPATYSPTRVRQVNGVLNIEPDGGTGNVTLGGDLTVSGGDINLSTSHTISAPNASSVQFTRNDTSTRSSLIADRLFIGNQTTRYIDDDGTRTQFSAGIDVNASSTLTSATFSGAVSSSATGSAFTAPSGGDIVLTGGDIALSAGDILLTAGAIGLQGSSGNVNLNGGGDVTVTGSDTSVPISNNGELRAIPNTTTATTNSARWVLISGSTYGLRRDSSTRRVKTNIVEADDAVLAAAKNLRAVHYEALEKDAEGNVVPSGKHTLGLIAEEIVDAGLGCAVTYDGEGLPDGYDERVLIAALLHRVNDLEARLAALEGA